MIKKGVSLLMALALCLTLLPASALAAEAQGQAGQEQTVLTQGNDGQTQAPGQDGAGEDDKTSDEAPDKAPDEEPDEAVSAVQALIDALPAAEDISDANADEVSGQLDAIDEAKQALTEEQAARLDLTGYDAAAAALLALAGEPDANESALLAAIAGTQPGGSGTAEDPYQITGAAELIWLRDAVNAGEANTCAELRQDVEYVDEVWTPVGTSEHPYTGTFSGNGHTIRVWLDGWGQALFGYIGAGAKLTDIAVQKHQSKNYSISASAPLARSNAGTITRCRYSGGITAKDSLGGLVYTNSGTIEACCVYAGRLNRGSRIEMYYGGWAGGIAYENTGTIANSYFYGDMVQAQSGDTVRDIIGWGAIAYKNSGTVSNCYYGADRDDGYGGKTEDQFRGGEVAYLLNGGTARDDWRQNCYAGDSSDATPVLDRSHAQVRKTGSSYVSLYPHVHCICGGDATSGGHPQHSAVTYTAWTNDEAASQYGDSSHTAANSLPKNPGYYYLTTSVTLADSDTWRPADGTVLCLNGRTVREFAFDTPAYDAITVGSGVTFSLTECASIQGYIYCASSRRAVHTVNNSGTFNLYNGRLRGTTSTADGAAVYNNGTFNMYGGTISNNGTTARGGGVYNAGGTVTVNGTLTASGGQYSVYNYGTLNLSGTVNANKNVYLGKDRTITVVGELDNATSIPVQTSATPAAGSPVVIATTENADWIKAGSFVSWTPGKYAVSRINEGKTVVLRGHEHDWSYTLGSDGTAISAECGNADGLCGNPNGGSVTIAPPSGGLIYDGSAKAARLTTTGWTAADVGEITYQKDGSALSVAPVDAGTYTAGITVGGQTASVTYTIRQAVPQAGDFAFSPPDTLTYDGSARTAAVAARAGIAGMGAVTVKYFKNGAETEPKDAGDYTVKVSVAEGANYNATTDDLTTDDWKFTIGKATQTITVPTDKTIVKDGIAEDISDWATVAGVTGGSAPGTLSYTPDGSYTGVALEGNQLTVDSSVATGTTITIKVTAAETDNYNAAEETFTVIVVDKATADVTITGLPGTVTYGQEFTLAASQTGDTTSANKKWTWDYDQEYFKQVGPNANTEAITLQAIKAGTPTKGITATYESGTHKGSATVNAVVEKKEVTVSGITAANKEYNGNNTATVNASGATITGKVDGDKLTITATGTFADADAGENKTVTLTLGTLGGADSANYTLATAGNQTETKANITAKDVSISAVTVSDKDYSGNANATVASVTITGVSGALSMGTDFDVTSATFPDADADTANVDVTINVALKDTAANNYNLTNGMGYVVTSAAKINKAAYGGAAPTKTVNILKNYAGVQTGRLTAADFFTTAPAEAKITHAVPNSNPSSMMSLAGEDSSGNFTYASKKNITAASDESWTITISSKNYTDITATLTFSPVDRTDAGVTISSVPASKTYGESFTLTASVTDAGTGTVSWTWTSNDPSVLQVTGTGASATVKALKAGSATISAKYESDTTMGEQTTAPITVGKRVITVTADNKSMTVNGTLPTFTVTYGNLPSGVQAADIFGTMASASTTTDGKTTGSFDITVTTPVLKTEAGANYEVGAVTKGTLTVNPRSSSGGGGGSSVSTYSVTVGKTDNGSVSVSPKSASKGDTVTVTVTPDKGYTLETLTVLDKNGKELKLTEKNGKYTFTMPAGKVEVKVTFMDDNTMLNYFVDVKAGDYFYDAVKWAAEKGITSGTDATHFGPNAACTRAQIVTFLWRTAGSPEPKSTGSFADVPTDSYYAKAVAWAVENGITGGTGDGKFSPNATCTREQAVAFLYRASGSPAVSGGSAFNDVAANAYYADAVAWAEKNEITGGIGGGLFGSGNDCTRAQIVTFLYRTYQGK